MDDSEELLNILQAHGQQFLKSFSRPVRSNNKKRKRIEESISQTSSKILGVEDEGDDNDEELPGIGGSQLEAGVASLYESDEGVIFL